MTTVAMDNLWKYIQGLNLSTRNLAWLENQLKQLRQNKQQKVSSDKTLMTMAELNTKIEDAEMQYSQGKCYSMLSGETFQEFRKRIGR